MKLSRFQNAGLRNKHECAALEQHMFMGAACVAQMT